MFTPHLEPALVRIFMDHFSQPVGAGFLVSPRHILTCAHVITAALRIPQDTALPPSELIHLDFPLLPQHPHCQARVIRWHPVNTEVIVGESEDIAVLELIETLPADAQPVPLIRLASFSDREVRLYGFPKGKEMGIYVNATLQGVIGRGYVQLNTELGHGQVEPGFSGTAVWDKQENGIVGMIVSIDDYQGDVPVYMIPANALIQAYQESQTVTPSSPLHISSDNPYNFWDPVTPPQFVGRTKEIQQLATALAEGRSLSVIGDWRMGKSSLLQTWAQHAKRQGHVVVSLSGEDSAAQSLDTFIKVITGLPGTTAPDSAADTLVQWSQQHTKPGLPPLLIIDEVETCIKRFDPRFFERLRGMLGTLILVLASWRELDRIFQEMGRTSPFENRLGMVRLGLLDPTAAATIRQWGHTDLDATDMEQMRQYAGCHPFYLQLLGYHLINAQRSGEPLKEAFDRFYQDASSRLRKLWHTLTEKEQQALRESLSGKPVERRSLRLRGVVTEEGQPFGKILTEWLEEE